MHSLVSIWKKSDLGEYGGGFFICLKYLDISLVIYTSYDPRMMESYGKFVKHFSRIPEEFVSSTKLKEK